MPKKKEGSPPQEKLPKKKKQAAKPKKSVQRGPGGWLSFGKLFVLSVMFAAIIAGAAWHQRHRIHQYLVSKVQMACIGARLDWESLTDKAAKIVLRWRIKNDLPIGVTLRDFTCRVLLNNVRISDGVQTSPLTAISGGTTSDLEMVFFVDSIRVRRVIQRTSQQKAARMLESVLDQLQGKKEGKGMPNFKGMLRVEGIASCRLLIGNLEIPLNHVAELKRAL